MGIGTYAFVKGFTGDVRDSIDKREEAERDRKKSIFLEELRRDTYKWQKDIDEIYDAKKPNKDMEQIDYTKGVKILKNSKGETIGEVPLTKSEMEAYDLDVRGKRAQTSSLETKSRYAEEEIKAGLARDYAAVDSSRASAENSRSGAHLNRRQAAALDGSSSNKPIASFEAGRELVSGYKGLDEQLTSEGFPREWIETTAAEAAAIAKAENIRSGGKIDVNERARQIFLRAIQNKRAQKTAAGATTTDPTIRPKL